MKKVAIIIATVSLITVACRNQDQNLAADVELPVSVEDLKFKPIEEFVNTTGTAFPANPSVKRQIPPSACSTTPVA